MTDFSAKELRLAAERELRRRMRDYPPKVARHRMSKTDADLQIREMAAIVGRLMEAEAAERLV
jgi:hypothetical protein